MQHNQLVRDPYRRCEERCRHDLGRGISVAELLGIDEVAEPPRDPSIAAAPFGPTIHRGPVPASQSSLPAAS